MEDVKDYINFPRLNIRTICLAFLLCATFLASACSIGFADDQFFKQKNSVDQLFRQDPNVSSLRSWDRAATKLRRFVVDNPRSDNLPEAMFLLGRIYETTFIKRNLKTRLSRATNIYERIARNHEGHELAANALIRLGDLRRQYMSDEIAARSAYYEVIDRYADRSESNLARERLGLPKEAILKTAAKAKPKQKVIKQIEKDVYVSVDEGELEKEKEEDKEGGGLLSSIFGGKDEIKEEDIDISAMQLKREYVVVIDPGHGGEDLGAEGVRHSKEKDVVLSISLKLADLLEGEEKIKTILTRETDVSLKLKERTERANLEQADLFISVHANASPNSRAKGIETYYLDNTNDRSSLKLAKRENEVRGGMDSDLQFIISDLIQSAKLDDSITVAHLLQEQMVGTVKSNYPDTKNLGVKKAPFYVLVGAHMPCVLVEVSFIDHPVEGKRLLQEDYQNLVARALKNGIRSYFSSIDG